MFMLLFCVIIVLLNELMKRKNVCYRVCIKQKCFKQCNMYWVFKMFSIWLDSIVIREQSVFCLSIVYNMFVKVYHVLYALYFWILVLYFVCLVLYVLDTCCILWLFLYWHKLAFLCWRVIKHQSINQTVKCWLMDQDKKDILYWQFTKNKNKFL